MHMCICLYIDIFIEMVLNEGCPRVFIFMCVKVHAYSFVVIDAHVCVTYVWSASMMMSAITEACACVMYIYCAHA